MGSEAFWVPAVIAAVSSGAQYANQRQAQKRQEAVQIENIRDQEQLRQKAASQARALTEQIGRNKPDQLEAKSTGEYVQQLRKNAGGKDTSVFGATAGASSRFQADSSRTKGEAASEAGEYAGTLSKIDAAVRQRQNEGQAMNTLSTNLSTIGAESWARNFVNQLRAQAAGVANPWVALGAGMINAGAKNYYPSGKTPTNPYAKVSAGGYDAFGNPLWAGEDMMLGVKA